MYDKTEEGRNRFVQIFTEDSRNGCDIHYFCYSVTIGWVVRRVRVRVHSWRVFAWL